MEQVARKVPTLREQMVDHRVIAFAEGHLECKCGLLFASLKEFGVHIGYTGNGFQRTKRLYTSRFGKLNHIEDLRKWAV